MSSPKIPVIQAAHFNASQSALEECIKHLNRLAGTELSECMQDRLKGQIDDLKKLDIALRTYKKGLEIQVMEAELQKLKEEFENEHS